MGVRQVLESKPLLGWALAALLLIAAAFTVYRSSRGGEQAFLGEMVTVRCRETGKEWKMSRGDIEKRLMLRGHPLNPDEGLPNPDTGKPTGFPVDDWKRMIDGLNSERQGYIDAEKPKP